MTFDDAFERLLGHEGRYANHPDDPGGETMYGITLRVARGNGYKGNMHDLPLAEAKRIAREEYWNAVRADGLPAELRFDVFDAAYNSSPRRASEWLQEASGSKVDGKVGPRTIAAVRALGPYRALARFNGIRLAFMADLPTWGVFGKGWARRIAANLMKA